MMENVKMAAEVLGQLASAVALVSPHANGPNEVRVAAHAVLSACRALADEIEWKTKPKE